MKAKITNTSPAIQGVWTDEGLVFVEPGKTRTLTIAKDHVERTKRSRLLKVVGAGADDDPASPFDHDGDGEDGGSKPADPPALSGKNKAELIDIAKAEDVDLEDDLTVAEIKAAIEAKRNG